ncbi:MAG: AEC family transporter [Opitutus sp.]
MFSYGQLLLLIVPVFAVVAVGVVIRRVQWVEAAAEASIIKVVINVCMPCLIFESIVGNAALRAPGSVLMPPLVGFLTTSLTIGAAYQFGRALGLAVGTGLRTFALAVGIANYAYLPLPIMSALFGPESRGVLLVHNIGLEMAIWTVGVLVLSGSSWKESRRRLLSPIVITLVIALITNLSGASPYMPRWLMDGVHSLAVCAIPLGLLITGINLANHIGNPRALFDVRVSLGGTVLRLVLFPFAFIALARWLPVAVELKRVIVVQGAMPAGLIPIIIAQHYGGRPLTAVQVVCATTAAAIVLTPLWLKVGLAWAGLSGRTQLGFA